MKGDTTSAARTTQEPTKRTDRKTNKEKGLRSTNHFTFEIETIGKDSLKNYGQNVIQADASVHIAGTCSVDLRFMSTLDC